LERLRPPGAFSGPIAEPCRAGKIRFPFKCLVSPRAGPTPLAPRFPVDEEPAIHEHRSGSRHATLATRRVGKSTALMDDDDLAERRVRPRLLPCPFG
jgi:hypothetical protein